MASLTILSLVAIRILLRLLALIIIRLKSLVTTGTQSRLSAVTKIKTLFRVVPRTHVNPAISMELKFHPTAVHNHPHITGQSTRLSRCPGTQFTRQFRTCS